MSDQLIWVRRSQPTPAGYYSTDGKWAILPERGGHTWELCEVVDPDGGYELFEFCDTVAEAKRIAQWQADKESGASLGECLGFQPINSRTHGYNGQEHR